MIVVTIAAGGAPDLDRLRKTLAERVTGASLDDHRAWVERMRTMTRAAVVVGIGVLGLVLAATVLLVAFATRGAMAANRAIVEVLHFVGAKNRYIAGQFQRHFLCARPQGGGHRRRRRGRALSRRRRARGGRQAGRRRGSGARRCSAVSCWDRRATPASSA